MSEDKKIPGLLKELIKLCKKEKIIGTNNGVTINGMEYYASFNFRPTGIPINKILKKPIKNRTEEEHQKLIEHKFNGSVRNYLLSMGKFKDVKMSTSTSLE